ncbi:MAPK/MAK/MRK overlapping kinase-like [Anopheles maculipalpis]|uniref:MAPK/MAK/MRK overlapping kinase-like n=1 Tax=Anopheles maculipalpis TaxID=1496333 RepID=UPI0021596E91|nr:MAPK/MAK/MRK overlapping kinase-like [Anopheles maculipalpis]
MSVISITGYDIIERIGSGAYSEVYHVRCRRTGKSYAAKHLIDACSDLNCDVAFPEIQLMKSVPSHPNIMQIFDHVFEKCSLTLIMDLMDMSLYDYMQTRSRPFSESRVRKMLYQIVLGLEHLHQNDIFHRDVKPENILVKFYDGIVGRRETLQLADFGSAARITHRPPFANYIATRWYRAPECMLSLGHYGPKMDVWAVGCCFYEMLTLKPLFHGENELEMLDAIHTLLGSPSGETLERFKPWNVNNLKFPSRRGIELRLYLPLLNAIGIDLMKRMLVYCPDRRISAKNLIKHVYFEELMKRKKLSKFSLSHQSIQYVGYEPISTARQPSQAKQNLKYQKIAGSSLSSVLSFQTNNTFHILSTEEQKRINKKKERMWNMNPASMEKQKHPFRTVRKQTKLVDGKWSIWS